MNIHLHKGLFALVATALLIGGITTSCQKDPIDDYDDTDIISGGGGNEDDPGQPFDPSVGPGADALFSVSPSKRVKIAPGNVQFCWHIGAGDTAYKFRFAEHAYDICGKDNELISRSCTTWIDLFGWSTGVWSWPAPSNNPAASTTRDSAYVHFTGNGDLIIGFDDWGSWFKQDGNWRTPSQEEWHYLLRGRPGNRFAKAVVSNVKGLVIFPDEWTMPQGVASFVNINDTAASFTENSYTASDWERLAAMGAAFLPCCGTREGSIVRLSGEYGIYWSSFMIHYEYGFGAGAICFYPDNVRTDLVNSVHEGHAVRLIQDAK